MLACSVQACSERVRREAFLEHFNGNHADCDDLQSVAALVGYPVDRCGECRQVLRKDLLRKHTQECRNSVLSSPVGRLVSTSSTPSAADHSAKSIACPLCTQPRCVEKKNFISHINSKHPSCSDVAMVSSLLGKEVVRCGQCLAMRTAEGLSRHMANVHGVGDGEDNGTGDGSEGEEVEEAASDAGPASPSCSPSARRRSQAARLPIVAIEDQPAAASQQSDVNSVAGAAARSIWSRLFVALGIAQLVEALLVRLRALVTTVQSSVPSLPEFSPVPVDAPAAAPAPHRPSTLAAVWRMSEVLGDDPDSPLGADEQANAVVPARVRCQCWCV